MNCNTEVKFVVIVMPRTKSIHIFSIKIIAVGLILLYIVNDDDDGDNNDN